MEDRGDTWKTAAGQESLLSLSLQGSPSPANSFISDTTQHKKSQNISDLKNLQLCWASDVKGSHSYPARAGPKGLRAESARAVTGRRNSHRWERGRLFEPSAKFFYGNSCNSGTES